MIESFNKIKIEKNEPRILDQGTIFVEKRKKGQEILPKKENGKFVLYHGTKNIFDKFKTPTGLEKMDVENGGVVYLTSDILVAKKYAGEGGYVVKVLTEKLNSYKDVLAKQGKEKQQKYTRNVYVNLPDEIEIDYFIPGENIEIKKN